MYVWHPLAMHACMHVMDGQPLVHVCMACVHVMGNRLCIIHVQQMLPDIIHGDPIIS
jgi:hypothetical protein